MVRFWFAPPCKTFSLTADDLADHTSQIIDRTAGREIFGDCAANHITCTWSVRLHMSRAVCNMKMHSIFVSVLLLLG